MTAKVLVAFTTNAGSTEEVAQAVADELLHAAEGMRVSIKTEGGERLQAGEAMHVSPRSHQLTDLRIAAEVDAARQQLGGESAEHPTVDVRRLEEVTSVDGYDAVIVGAPMILGWHRAAVSFVRKHRAALAGKKVAYFCTAMSLTETGERAVRGVPICVDTGLAKLPQHPGRMGIKERYATLTNYLRPVLGAAPEVTPLSVAFFGGKLEFFRLKWWQALFVMVVIQAPPGDLRDFQVVRRWARELAAQVL